MSSPKRKVRLSSVAAVLLVMCGLASVIYGCWLVYHPAGWIIGGLLVAVISLLVARETLEPDEPR